MRAPVRFALSHCLFEALDGCVQKRVEFFNRNVVFEIYAMVFALSDTVSEDLQRSDVCASARVRVLSVASALCEYFQSSARCESTFGRQRLYEYFQ